MKISYNWIKKFIKIDLPSEQVGVLLTDLGLEVEGIETFESIKGGLKGVVVGHVLECEQHPNADRLKITKVDVGQGTILQIVCGAPNVAKGQKVPVATIGTKLFDKEGNSFEIKKGKIRGEESFGMICAEDELGLGEGHEGILILDEKYEPGTPCSEIFEVESDEIFEIGLTPNRADAMSHYGVARDLRAGLMQHGTHLELITPSVTKFHVDNRLSKIDIEVKNKDLVPRYAGVAISNVKVAESPKWLQNKLKAIGLTPKNNIVDITNYVLHGLGQPLHAFDVNHIVGKKIIVKTAEAGTKLTTLDGVERTLDAEDIVICDTEKPLCIAGVLGGINSGVTTSTRTIFLESAYFNPVSVRKTAKRHGINTDASFRFERGINVNDVKYALMYAAILIENIAGGVISSDIVDLYPKKHEDFQVFLAFDKVNKLVGQVIPTETIKNILHSLDIKVNSITERGLGLLVPTYRVDVQREADVIEEILRVYGYNNISFSEKTNASMSHSSKYDDHNLQNTIANQLIGQGFFEIMTNSLVSEKVITDYEQDATQAVKILNPLSNDLSFMRKNLLFSALEVIEYNINRKNSDLKLFEFGKSYHLENGKYNEDKHLIVCSTGNQNNENWNISSQKTDFFFLKGTIEAIFERLGLKNISIKPLNEDNSFIQEGFRWFLGETLLGTIGVIKNKILKDFGIKQEVLFANICWNVILENVKNHKIIYQEISKFPKVRRDLALLLDENISFNDIYKIACETEKSILKDISLFDVYQGDKLPEGKKSYAVSFTLQDINKTLTDKQIDKSMQNLLRKFEEKLGASLRD
ncbi:phenylalanine--tRNA ligase subunit beta [Capnocytophaga cynodegmi]|uniref:Phenylalanine--tRNA ligase beta subunit n=1 Tax=Capnocytophaga cynodegmi TaxID=28189 RepID=A0A0B7H548_9FLAO|nr:phenylalanine--tRNA ligase subunit beta [Capnocytophaga cynodegmi]CEN34721.1 Phenylalanine--tRNA ligase beta subunit [Capnocytophaga cynodegmi]CEN38932.1 Phenylalanine--tRNA ligase beta subunit [Capnocytophaga cynodegmi]